MFDDTYDHTTDLLPEGCNRYIVTASIQHFVTNIIQKISLRTSSTSNWTVEQRRQRPTVSIATQSQPLPFNFSTESAHTVGMDVGDGLGSPDGEGFEFSNGDGLGSEDGDGLGFSDGDGLGIQDDDGLGFSVGDGQ